MNKLLAKSKYLNILFPIFVIFIMSLLIFTSSCENNSNLKNNNNLKEKGLNKSKQMQHIIYTCPMHPEIKQDKPGDCPICNMKLIPIKDTTKHPEHSNLNKENLKDLNKFKQMNHIIYTCPMHPEIKQDRPGDCPICNMKLIPIKDTTKHTEHSDLNKENLKEKI
jgi:Cu(I)/Ag(I) efflux system membrane fusion protein